MSKKTLQLGVLHSHYVNTEFMRQKFFFVKVIPSLFRLTAVSLDKFSGVKLG